MVKIASFKNLTLLATLFAFFVVGLGAYTRLTDAGLGCPDWPGCYGALKVPTANVAAKTFPAAPLEAGKAWTEMFHRYVAGGLVLLIVSLTYLGIKRKQYLGLVLVGLVFFQAALGMWTVTLKLMPAIVMGHLLGGLTTLSLLWWWHLSNKHVSKNKVNAFPRLKLFTLIGFILVATQIALGGLTSSHYAALACIDFPSCLNQTFFPAWNLGSALNLFHPGNADFATKVTIHMLHRVGATTIALFFISYFIFFFKQTLPKNIKRTGIILLHVLVLQIALGISNVLYVLPLPVAVLHNLTAALLLLTLLTLINQMNTTQPA